ncbi:MAG: hypothetical protein Q4C63_01805 [Eubacteriales bacterium]|nr:hypothetical protein [Eubacteriales bacterium]
MRSNLSVPVIAFAASLVFAAPAYGSINGNEAELLAIIGSTREYNGVLYQVDPEYQRAARAYLDDPSIDCTDEQKAKAINRMFGSIQQGIDEGYLIPVGQSAASGTTSGSSSDIEETANSAEAPAAEKHTETGQPAAAESGTKAADRAEKSGGTAKETPEGAGRTETGEAAQTGGETQETEERFVEEPQTEVPAEREVSPIVLALEEAMYEAPELSERMGEGSLIPAAIYPAEAAKYIALAGALLTVVCAGLSAAFGLFRHHRKKR